MRVKTTLVTMLVMLLALGALSPLAGAIYMEGQTIPDDGMMHILAAESGLGEATPADTRAGADVLVSIPAGSLPSYVWDDWLSLGLPGGVPVSGLPFEGMASIPSASLPYEIVDSSPGIIEKQMPSAAAGPESFFDTGSLQTNIPTLDYMFS